MFSISQTPTTKFTQLISSQPDTKTDLPSFNSGINQVKNIKNTPESSSLMKRRLVGPNLKLNLFNLPKVVTEQISSDFQKLEKETDKHSDNYTSIASSRYPDIKTAVKTQVFIKNKTTGESIPLPANYLQVADKNIAIRAQYPKNTELSIEQHLTMLMAEKPSVLVVIASQNDIDGSNLQNNPEKNLPLYFSHNANYGSIEVKSKDCGELNYANQVSANNYQLTLIKDGQKVTLPVIHVTNWNDRTTISVEALRALVVDINQHSKNEDELPVIHCMSGSGRAGTVVAAMQLTQPNNQYSVYEVVESLRNTGTSHIVQVEEQYQTLTKL